VNTTNTSQSTVDINQSRYRDFLIYSHPEAFKSAPVEEQFPGYPQLPNATEAQPTAKPQIHVLPSVVPPKPLLTKVIHDKTVQLLAEARKVSGSILNRHIQPVQLGSTAQTQPIYTAPVHFDFSDRSVRVLNSETHHHHHYHGERHPNQKEDDTGVRVLVGITAFIGALFLAYKTGQAVAQGEKVQKQAVNFEELKGDWEKNKTCYDNQFQSLVDRVVKRVDNILQRRETNRAHKMALLILGLVACGTGFGGAVVGSGFLMVTGVGIGALAGVVALYKLGYAYFSTLDQDDAEEIDLDLNQLSQLQQPIPV
jgi:hypothetical protein